MSKNSSRAWTLLQEWKTQMCPESKHERLVRRVSPNRNKRYTVSVWLHELSEETDVWYVQMNIRLVQWISWRRRRARGSCAVCRAAWESPPVRARAPDRWDRCSAPSATTWCTETQTESVGVHQTADGRSDVTRTNVLTSLWKLWRHSRTHTSSGLMSSWQMMHGSSMFSWRHTRVHTFSEVTVTRARWV